MVKVPGEEHEGPVKDEEDCKRLREHLNLMRRECSE